jgi:hypothetical protein
MEALQTATVRVVAVIAEGVPEKDTKKLIAFARANNKVIIGPATVGGVQVGVTMGTDTITNTDRMGTGYPLRLSLANNQLDHDGDSHNAPFLSESLTTQEVYSWRHKGHDFHCLGGI